MSTRRYGPKELERDFGKLTFGLVLESFRLGEEWSQRKMAKKLRMSPQSLCDIEKGRKIPSPGRAAKIAKRLGRPIPLWVQYALQDCLNREHLKLKVSVA